MTADPNSSGDSAGGPEGPEAGCLHRVRAELPRLTGARRRVADVVLSDPWSVRGVSILMLARQARVSENAVTRFTHAVGYSGYREFTQALALDLGKSLGVYHVHPVDEVAEARAGGEGPLDLVRRVVSLEIESMRDTLASLSEPVLRHVITRLATARQILLIGTGTAAPLCHLLSYRLASIGAAATWTSDPMMMLAQAARLGAQDVALAVSYSGRSRDTVQALDFARRCGADTIAMTAHPRAPIGDVAASVLAIFSPNVPEATAQFSARIAGMSLLEAIATAVAMEREGGPSPLLHDLGEAQATLNDLPPDWRPAR